MTIIRIFNFPILVIEEIVRSMDPVERTHISVISQKAQRLMKSIRPKMSEDYNLVVELGSQCEIWFFNQNNEEEKLPLHSNLLIAHEETERINIAQKLANNIWDTFGDLPSHFILEMDMENEVCRNSMFTWASQMKEKLTSIEYVGTVSPDQRVSQFLHEFKHLPIVKLRTQETGNFLNDITLDFKEFYYTPSVNIPRELILTQLSAHWLNVTSFTSEDLNRFFRRYLQEDRPEGYLGGVTMEVRDRNVDIIFNQVAVIELVVEDEQHIEFYKIQHPNEVHYILIFIGQTQPDFVEMKIYGNPLIDGTLLTDGILLSDDDSENEEDDLEEEDDKGIEE